MYKVTRELIKKRQPHCELPLEHVTVKNLGGGILNDCYGNAHRLRDKDKNFFMVSGWLILPYSEKDGCVKVVQHWFNINLTKRQYVDTSPVEQNIEYVADMNLYKYCQANDSNLSTHVAMSLIYENERFKSVRDYDNKNQIVSEVEGLTTEYLYIYAKNEVK